jgi:hypothetical protein
MGTNSLVLYVRYAYLHFPRRRPCTTRPVCVRPSPNHSCCFPADTVNSKRLQASIVCAHNMSKADKRRKMIWNRPIAFFAEEIYEFQTHTHCSELLNGYC